MNVLLIEAPISPFPEDLANDAVASWRPFCQRQISCAKHKVPFSFYLIELEMASAFTSSGTPFEGQRTKSRGHGSGIVLTDANASESMIF